jgi:hypothetical protein
VSSHLAFPMTVLRFFVPRDLGSERVICPARYVQKQCSRFLTNSSIKEEAVRGLIQTLQMYPDDTIFYLYTWCTGYVHDL